LGKTLFKTNFQALLGAPRRTFYSLLFLIWALFIFSRYFDMGGMPNVFSSLSILFSFPSFGPWNGTQHLGVWLSTLGALAVSFLAILNSWWLGSVILGITGPRQAKGLIRWTLEMGLGALGSSLFWMGTGLVHLWFEPPLIFLWSLAAGPAIWKLKELSPVKVETPSGILLKGFVLTAVVYELFAFVQALLPETFYDSLNYFLGIPQYWVLKKAVVDDPGHILSSYFHGGTLYFMDGFYFGGSVAAKLLSFFSVFCCAVFTGAWAKEEAGANAGWTAFALTATFPLLFLNGWAVRVDGLLTFCHLLFFYAARKFLKESRPAPLQSWGVLAAALAGFAMTVKPTAVTGIAAVFLAAGLLNFRELKRKGFGLWIWMALVSAGLVAPWLLKNFFFTGNPFFPYGVHLAGGRSFFAPGMARLLYENQQFLKLGPDFKSWLTFPWRLLGPGANAQFAGPLAVAFVPLSLFSLRQKGDARFFTVAAFLFLALGLCLSHMLRFVMPAFVVLFMAWAVGAAKQKGIWNQLTAGLALAAALFTFPYFLDTAARYFNGFGLITGAETQDQYLRRMVQNPYQDLVDWTGDHLPADARILIAGDTRGLYYQRDFLANSAFDEPFLEQITKLSVSPGEMAEKIKRLGLTHAVVNTNEGFRLSPDYHLYEMTAAQWKQLNLYLALYWRPLTISGSQGVYEIEAEPQKPAPPALFPVNPFSFFTAGAHDFAKALASNEWPAALSAALAQQALFPGDSFWNQKVLWVKKQIALGAVRQPKDPINPAPLTGSLP
jgi:hypothetical protein